MNRLARGIDPETGTVILAREGRSRKQRVLTMREEVTAAVRAEETAAITERVERELRARVEREIREKLTAEQAALLAMREANAVLHDEQQRNIERREAKIVDYQQTKERNVALTVEVVALRAELEKTRALAERRYHELCALREGQT